MAFLTKKWAKEHGYRLRKELFAFTENKVCSPVGVLASPGRLPLLGYGHGGREVSTADQTSRM